jgi:hypothetical protein
MPDDRKILVKLWHGKWETEDMISEQFVQDVGSEISRFLEEDQPARVYESYLALKTRPKRARIPKYFLI